MQELKKRTPSSLKESPPSPPSSPPPPPPPLPSSSSSSSSSSSKSAVHSKNRFPPSQDSDEVAKSPSKSSSALTQTSLRNQPIQTQSSNWMNFFKESLILISEYKLRTYLNLQQYSNLPNEEKSLLKRTLKLLHNIEELAKLLEKNMIIIQKISPSLSEVLSDSIQSFLPFISFSRKLISFPKLLKIIIHITKNPNKENIKKLILFLINNYLLDFLFEYLDRLIKSIIEKFFNLFDDTDKLKINSLQASIENETLGRRNNEGDNLEEELEEGEEEGDEVMSKRNSVTNSNSKSKLQKSLFKKFQELSIETFVDELFTLAKKYFSPSKL